MISQGSFRTVASTKASAGGGVYTRQLVQVQVLAIIARTLENHSKN